MNKTKIKDIVFRKSDKEGKHTYDTDEMISVVEAYIFVRKGITVNINLNKIMSIMGVEIPVNMTRELQLLQLAFEDAQGYFINNKDKLD